MSNRVLIDTSVWILALRQSPVAAIRGRVEGLLAEERVAITPINCLELLGGTRSEVEFDRLKNRLDALHRIEITQEVWEESAKLGFNLRRAGKTIPNTDLIIASAAILAGATLLHADRHFDLVAEETPLSVESLVHLI
ncbi:MAG: PIN domain nuclease [Dehalococcoidia bacterium]|nr:PIN domain nuclease [Dehalococcoidia bacterium]